MLPTGGTLTQDYRIFESWFLRFREISIAPLFQDVEQAMRSGLFYDIQTCYEEDRTLGKDALNGQVMDAGTLGERRYLHPRGFSNNSRHRKSRAGCFPQRVLYKNVPYAHGE